MNKLRTIENAIARIESGTVVMLGGFMTVGTPEKLVDALVKQGIHDLTVICNDGGSPGKGVGKFVRAHMIKKYITSHIGLNPEMQALVDAGEVEVELVPQGTLAERIRTGGAGLGGVLTPTGLGTEIQNGKKIINVGGKDFILEEPLKADVALIKAHRADRFGNLVFRKAARNFNPIMATACEYVIAEVEHIEDVGCIDPDMVMLPGIFVDAIVM